MQSSDEKYSGKQIPVRKIGWLKVSLLSLGLCGTLAAGPAGAWGNMGHETVGAIADQLIAGTRAEREVGKLLDNGETLSSVSIWADCAKGYCGPLTGEMKSFVSGNPQHHDYHFTDIPFQLGDYHDGAVGTSDHDVVQTLKQAIEVLRGNPDPAANPHQFTPRQALLLIAHLVGDVHQPLHVGTAYMDEKSAFAVPPDQASIDDSHFYVTHGDNYLMKGSKALHSYWDTDIVNSVMRRAKAATPEDLAGMLLSDYPTGPSDPGDPSSWPQLWATETLLVSHDAHKKVVPGARYEAQDRNGNPHYAWPVTVPASYLNSGVTIVRKQLVRAGYRTANLLQAIWP